MSLAGTSGNGGSAPRRFADQVVAVVQPDGVDRDERLTGARGVGTWSLKTAYPILMLWGRLMISMGPGAPSTGLYQQNVPDRRSDASDP